MSNTVLILYLCLHGHCVHDTIPFNGTIQECVIGWQSEAIKYMKLIHPGYELKRASCVTDGVEL